MWERIKGALYLAAVPAGLVAAIVLYNLRFPDFLPADDRPAAEHQARTTMTVAGELTGIGAVIQACRASPQWTVATAETARGYASLESQIEALAATMLPAATYRALVDAGRTMQLDAPCDSKLLDAMTQHADALAAEVEGMSATR